MDWFLPCETSVSDHHHGLIAPLRDFRVWSPSWIDCSLARLPGLITIMDWFLPYETSVSDHQSWIDCSLARLPCLITIMNWFLPCETSVSDHHHGLIAPLRDFRVWSPSWIDCSLAKLPCLSWLQTWHDYLIVYDNQPTIAQLASYEYAIFVAIRQIPFSSYQI
jgi:hypothetical protein